MKKKNLSVNFGVRLGIEIILLITVLTVLSVFLVKNGIEKTYITSNTELIHAEVQGLAYRNSKFMQQLRMYTFSDIVRSGGTPEEIVEWLVAHRGIRSSDFDIVMYCDYESGIGYSDDDEEIDVSNTEYFKVMKSGKSQYVSNSFGKGVDDSLYYVCKALSVNGKKIGFIAAAVSHDTLEKAIDMMTIGESGYAVLLSGEGLVMAHPDDSLVMSENFLNDRSGKYGVSAIAPKIQNGEEGSEWIDSAEGRLLVTYAPVNGTPWTLCLFVPAKQVYAMASQLGFSMIISTIVIVFILIGTAIISIIRILRPLRHLDRNLNGIASGNADLTQRVKVTSFDDIGSVSKGFNTFVEKLQSIVKEIIASRNDLALAGDEMHNGIVENSRSIADILSNIESVRNQIVTQSNSVDETAGAVNEIASNISSLERMIETQSHGVAEASSAVEEMIGNIGSVNQSVSKMAVSFEDLEAKAQSGNVKQREMNERIAEIESQSKMLQEANQAIAAIANQTNLLAMNAAIEAAHAGEAGQGFSVVADEIRNLSETSAVQSKTIGEQLKKIKNTIETVVETSADTSRTFTSLSDSIRETDQLVRQIKSAMEEQQEGSKQIVTALHNMSDSTAEVKTASAEMSEGNKQILNEVRLLKDATTEMKDSVTLMSSSAMKIRETGSALDTISEKMKSSITKIGTQIDNFSV
ncbi:MAG: HAMP domain-containing protein [Treponema sp.]|nr:HAMP domain-containing protein [Candidatus Treponema equifaecale]